MAHEVLIPPLGQTVDTVTLVTWYKKEGETVEEGEALFAIETDKATLDVEAQASGILHQVIVPEGQDVQVLSVVAMITSPEEDVEEHEVAQEPSAGSPPVLQTIASQEEGERELSTSISHSTRPPVHWIGLLHSTGSVHHPDSRLSTLDSSHQRTFISPRARRLAEERGVAIENLSATGPEGAIVERDVRAYMESQTTAAPGKIEVVPFNEVLAEIPLHGIRAIIAERMAQSTSTTARVTLTAEVDASALVLLRKQLAEDGVAVSYNDLFLYMLGRVLREQPAINASLERETLRMWKRVHIGLAVDTEHGLMVPVIRDVDTKGLARLSEETIDLIERARTGTLTPDELQGGTFTLTNLGMFGVDVFTPIINLPETAILGVGRIKPRPVVRDGEIVIRDIVWLSLAFDHRIVDGGPAARFLQHVVQLVEHPHLMHA